MIRVRCTMSGQSNLRFTIAWSLLAVTGLAILVFGIVTTIWPGGNNAQLTRATGVASVGMGLFGMMITLKAFRDREWWAWLVLWYYPSFWLIHLVAGLPPGREHIHQVAFIVVSLGALLVSIDAFPGRRIGPDKPPEPG